MSNEQKVEADTQEAKKVLTWKEFLETHPPDCKEVHVTELGVGDIRGMSLSHPELHLFCESESCRKYMSFDCMNGSLSRDLRDEWEIFIRCYQCRHCKKTEKTYAVMVKIDSAIDRTSNYKVFTPNGTVVKFGEYPSFGDPLPSGVISLLGSDQDLFMKGRRAEKMGMGIGAFGYYRRVVENQWQRLIDAIIRVAKAQNVDQAIIANLEIAKKENQFEKAIDMTKDQIPKSLLIDGSHNPLKLLHSALSQDIHSSTDEQCLIYANDIREMLVRFAAMLDEALKDRTTLNETLSRLLQRREEKIQAQNANIPQAIVNADQ